MAYYSVSEVKARGSRRALTASAAPSIVLGRAAAAAAAGGFDIFLSHSFRDAELVLGLKDVLESTGLSVYVDWVVDPQLDRGKVTAATADMLRKRLGQCSAFVYATSQAAVTSRWMPWELGYFDGLRSDRSVLIMPLTTGSTSNGFAGQEYLGLYDTVDKSSYGTPVGLPVHAGHGRSAALNARPNGGRSNGSAPASTNTRAW